MRTDILEGRGESTGGALDGEDRVTADRELAQVLPRDLGVGADVEDAGLAAALLTQEAVGGAGDDAAGDQGLAQADLVGDQERADRVGIRVQPRECVVDGAALEGLQRLELGLDVMGASSTGLPSVEPVSVLMDSPSRT